MLYEKVSRNEPCPCGSGKKYKKCCGMQKTVSITSIIEKEVLELQVELIQYAMNEYDIEIDNDFEDLVESLLTEDEEEMEFYVFLHTLWFAIIEPIDNGETILQRFIRERSRTIKRSKVKEILHSWTNPRPIAGRVIEIDSSYLTVLDALTEEAFMIKQLEPLELQENMFVFGFVVPFGADSIFLPTPFDSIGTEDFKEEKYLKGMYEESGYKNPIAFLEDEFIHLMNEIPFVTIGYGAENFEWKNPKHKEVAALYEEKMQEMGAPSTNTATGIILWYKYCEKFPRLVKKPETYAAAIHYINLTVNPLLEPTKKEIAAKYGISPSTLGTAITDMEIDLSDEIRQLKGLYLEQIVESLEAEGIGFPEDFEAEFADEEDDDGNLPF